MRSSYTISIIDHLNKIVKKIIEIKNLAYIENVWMYFFFQILCRLLKYYFIRL